jgi:hypothetical protein
MKLFNLTSALLLVLCPSVTTAFAPATRRLMATAVAQQSQLAATAAAKSKEEDLELTRKVIQEFMGSELSSDSPPETVPEPKKEPAKEE